MKNYWKKRAVGLPSVRKGDFEREKMNSVAKP
jgi:hypothetical protein